MILSPIHRPVKRQFPRIRFGPLRPGTRERLQRMVLSGEENHELEALFRVQGVNTAPALLDDLLGNGQTQASEFVIQNREVLGRLPVACFLTCLTLARPTEENRMKALGFLDPLHRDAPRVKPVDIGLFAGVLDYDKLSFMVRTVMKIKMKDKGVDEGDYRDWASIRSWARDVGPRLLNGSDTSKIDAG